MTRMAVMTAGHGSGHEGGPVVTTPAVQEMWPSLTCLASLLIPESVFQSHSIPVNSGMALFQNGVIPPEYVTPGMVILAGLSAISNSSGFHQNLLE